MRSSRNQHSTRIRQVSLESWWGRVAHSTKCAARAPMKPRQSLLAVQYAVGEEQIDTTGPRPLFKGAGVKLHSKIPRGPKPSRPEVARRRMARAQGGKAEQESGATSQ